MTRMHSFIYSPLSLIAIFFVVLILALGTSRIAQSASGEHNAREALMVRTLGADREVGPVSADLYVGRVEADQRVEVGFDSSGRVIVITKKEGESFAKGDLLARLDTDRLQARQAELKAQVDRAKAGLRLAESSLQRALGLKKSGSISDQALDEAYQRRDAAEAEHQVVLAQLDSIGVELDKSELYAPFDGVVIDRLSDIGRTVVVGVPILLLEESGEPEIKVDVPLAKAQRLQIGERVRVEHHNGEFEAPIARINLSINSRRVSEVYIKPEDLSPALVSGELVQVELGTLQADEGVWVPIAALTEFGRGLWSVYIARPDSDGYASVEKAVVELRRIRGDKALIGAGLSADQLPHIVREATHRIVAGQRVRLESNTQYSQAH